MKLLRNLRIAAMLMATMVFLGAQMEPAGPGQDVRLPSGKLQREEILRVEHQKTIEDAGKLIEMAEELKAELEKNDRHVLSISSLKKAEEIENLAKRIRKRLKRY